MSTLLNESRELAHFLETQQDALGGLVEQAYKAVGPNYAALPAEQGRALAWHYTQTWINDLLHGSLDRTAAQQIIADAAGYRINSQDLMRMAVALDGLFSTFVRQQFPGHSDLALELLRRHRHVNASLRATLTTAHLDALLQRFSPPPAHQAYS
jgi:hypothetical protein